MKRSELYFIFILLPLDIIIILFSFITAYWIRQRVEIPPVSYMWPFLEYLRFVIVLIPVWIAFFAIEGLYHSRQSRRGLDEFAGIFIGVSAGIMLVVAWIFLTRTFFFSRLVVIYTWILAIIGIALGRWLIRFLQHYLYRYGIGVHRVVVVGKGNIAQSIAREIASNRGLGYRLVRSIPGSQIQVLEKLTVQNSIDEVMLVDPDFTTEQILKLMDYCQEKKLTFKHIPSVLEVRSKKVLIQTMAGVPILEFQRSPLDGWGKIIKRSVDLFGALIFLIVLSPIMLLVSLMVWFDSGRPIFFKQERVGDRKNFIFYKFRTMKVGADKEHNQMIKKYGIMFKLKDDPRVTKIGKFLRKTSLDEIPQIFNVLKGDMSLVGPRPPMPVEVSHYSKFHRQRLGIKPGMTGLWQVSGRSDISFDEWVRLDSYYIENWSLWLDTTILLKTALVVFSKRGAY